MRFIIFLLFLNLPSAVVAANTLPIIVAESVVAQEVLELKLGPQKHQQRNQFAIKIAVKRLKKALNTLGPSVEERVKWVSMLGFSCSLLGILLLLFFAAGSAITAGIALGLILLSLPLCLIALRRAKKLDKDKKRIKGLAKIGIVLSSIVLILLLLAVIIAGAFQKQEG